jgi:hypothetical protein
MEDWYTISLNDIISHYGARLVAKFDNSPSRMVMGVLVDHPWHFWKFTVPHRGVFDNPKNVQEYIQYLFIILLFIYFIHGF